MGLFNPCRGYYVTQDQACALENAQAPSCDNPFLTESGLLGGIGAAYPMSLASSVKVGATSVQPYSVFKDVVANGGWGVIDPYTVECEYRKVTGVVGNILQMAALSYAHGRDDVVLWNDAPVWKPILFGAVYDGVTDDSAALQACIDDAPAGAIVDLDGPGTMLLASIITIDKTLTIRGGYINRVDQARLFNVTGTAVTDTVIFENVVEWTLAGHNNQCDFIRTSTTDTIDNIFIRNCRTRTGNILLAGNVAGMAVIDRCRVNDNHVTAGAGAIIALAPNAVGISINQAWIINNYVYCNGVNGTTGALQVGGNTDYLFIIGNHLRNHPEDGIDGDAGTRFSIIANNVIRNMGKEGVELKPGSRADGNVAEKVICTGNQIESCQRGIQFDVRGVCANNVIRDCAVGIRVTGQEDGECQIGPGNYIYDWSSHGIWLDGEGVGVGNPTNVAVFGNWLDGNNNVERGIRARNCDYITIEHNTILRVNQVGIECAGDNSGDTPGAAWDNIWVRFNRVDDCQDGVVVGAVAPATMTAVVRDNIVTNYSNRAMRESGAGATIQIYAPHTFTNNDATPQVNESEFDNFFICSHTNPTNITNFDQGFEGQEIEVHFTTANATLVDGANIMLDGSANYNAPAGTVMRFRNRGGVWYEVSRRNT